MNDALKMQISAFVDGELPENESELLLRRLSQDAAMRRQVEQYLSVGRLMRREHELPSMATLRGRIAASLGDDAVAPSEVRASQSAKFVKPVAGFAIAASVAALALFGLRQTNLPDDAIVPAATESVVRTSPGITEPAIDALTDDRLLEMHRWHADAANVFGTNSSRTQLVTLELRDGKLVEIEPDGHLAQGIPSANDDETDESNDGESDDGEQPTIN